MKTLTITATGKAGNGEVEVECPVSLKEACEVYGELEVFKGFLRDRVIIWQRNARPVSVNGEPKNKKRLSVFDRLQNS